MASADFDENFSGVGAVRPENPETPTQSNGNAEVEKASARCRKAEQKLIAADDKFTRRMESRGISFRGVFNLPKHVEPPNNCLRSDDPDWLEYEYAQNEHKSATEALDEMVADSIWWKVPIKPPGDLNAILDRINKLRQLWSDCNASPPGDYELECPCDAIIDALRLDMTLAGKNQPAIPRLPDYSATDYLRGIKPHELWMAYRAALDSAENWCNERQERSQQAILNIDSSALSKDCNKVESIANELAMHGLTLIAKRDIGKLLGGGNSALHATYSNLSRQSAEPEIAAKIGDLLALLGQTRAEKLDPGEAAKRLKDRLATIRLWIEQADGQPPQPALKPQRRGRQKADYETVQREAKIATDWQQAKSNHVYKGDFAKELGMSIAELDKLLGRVAWRKR